MRVLRDTVDQVADEFLKQPEGSRWYVLFPVENPRRYAEAARPSVHAAVEGIQPAVSERQDVRVFDARIAARHRFHQAVCVLVDRLAITGDLHQRIVDSVEICYREAGEVIFEQAGGEGKTLRFNEKFACKTCGDGVPRSGAGPVQLQQPDGRLSALPGFRQHDRLRHGSGDSGHVAVAEEGAVDPWTKPQHEWAWKHFKAEQKGKVRFDVPFCDLNAKERAVLLAAVREYFAEVEEKKYKVHVRVFLSRYRGYARVPRLQRLAAAEGSAVRTGRREDDRRSRADEHGGSAGVLRRRSKSRRKRARSPTKCWSKSASGSSS